MYVLTVERRRVRPFSGSGACTKQMAAKLALLAISPRQMLDVHAPFQRRLAPFLSSRRKFSSLVNASNAQAISDDIGIGRIRVERGPAHRAEGLGSLGAAFRPLDIHGRRSRHQRKGIGDGRYGDAIRRACQSLAVGAMADRHSLGIDDGFVRDCSAMTPATHFHGDTFVASI